MNSNCHVLIVEDDPPVRKLLQRQLTSLGCRVDVACDGREGLSLWECGDFDLVITDVSMPGMDGWELASRIRASGRRMAQLVPVIAMTGHAEDRSRSAKAGVTDHISKPFSILDLQRVLDHWETAAWDGNPPASLKREPGDVVTGAAAPDLAHDPSIMQSILLTFIQTIPDYAHSLHAACAAGDHVDIAAAVHKLKSAARLVGGDEVADLCAAVEDASQDSDIDTLRKLAKPIPDVLRALERSLKGVLASQEPAS
jgi:CheY-like chemotaxis protein/HPt (histidine-containing phosphotransfer) domain-containing protein